MICEHCEEAATVHFTDRVGDEQREVHLCAACARKAGLLLPEAAPGLALEQVIKSFIQAHVGEIVGGSSHKACACCGLSYLDFRAQSRLGCAHDAVVFAESLRPTVIRFQGASRHVGKQPRRLAGPGFAERALRLRAELRDAVDREAYERAAQLRDLLRQFSGLSPASSSATPNPGVAPHGI